MRIVLISNNELSTNCYFEDEPNIETKKKLRPLNIEGEVLAKKLSKEELFEDIERIYADASSGSISSAKYLAERLNQDIIVNKRLYDCKIGDLKGKTIKMLSYFQEHDFTFKLPGGESLQECGNRIVSFIRSVINEGYENVAVYLPKRCMMAYLMNHTETGYNLDERLILTYKDEVILGNSDEKVDVFIVEYHNKEVNNIKNYKME
jgi:broad specificity phosphatase PhoE